LLTTRFFALFYYHMTKMVYTQKDVQETRKIVYQQYQKSARVSLTFRKINDVWFLQYTNARKAVGYADGSGPWTKTIHLAKGEGVDLEGHFVMIGNKNSFDVTGLECFIRFTSRSHHSGSLKFITFLATLEWFGANVGNAFGRLPTKEAAWNETIKEVCHMFACRKSFPVHADDKKYVLDLYFPEVRLAIECDEQDHKDRDAKKELQRESAVARELKCSFYRFAPENEEITPLSVAGEIMFILMELKRGDFMDSSNVWKAPALDNLKNPLRIYEHEK
jgi:very-short-patch-repair endonuclease